MLHRCRCQSSIDFKKYGGRGIAVCERWLKFENFLEDMGDRPDGTTLGRRDNDGPYKKDNCRWETPTQQNANRRDLHWITVVT